MTAVGMVSIRRPIRRANRWVKWRTSRGMSSGRSRRGGSTTGNTFRRKYRSLRKRLSATSGPGRGSWRPPGARPRPAGAEVGQGPRNQFLPGTGLPENEDRGIGGGDGLDLLQDPAEGAALADDLPEVLVGADLLFQVDLLLEELVLERLDLLK